MSQHFNTDGRLNLEQQRKRAKELLARLKTQDFPAPPCPRRQWAIAKDWASAVGPSSRPMSMRVDFAARHPGFDASDEARTTHWRCGNDIAHSLGVAGFKGRLPDADRPIVHGPGAGPACRAIPGRSQPLYQPGVCHG